MSWGFKEKTEYCETRNATVRIGNYVKREKIYHNSEYAIALWLQE